MLRASLNTMQFKDFFKQFKNVFIAVFIGTALIFLALILHQQRPKSDLAQPHASYVKATGKCAECHSRETSSIVHQFEGSRHAQKGVTCLDCHKSVEGQEDHDHRGFTIAKHLTSKNCQQCHATEYSQFEKSRHGAPAWAAVHGSKDFTPEQIALSEKYHKGAVKREANTLAQLEGTAAITKGCVGCHSIGRPNEDGSIGQCTECHGRHASSIALARHPQTCGQCHMGPDHSQVEIYFESKHGALFHAQKDSINFHAKPKTLTTKEFPVPTCATCHMSGLEGMKVTHDVTERLSYWLFAPVSEKRPTFEQGRGQMKELCLKCHSKGHVEKFYQEADAVLVSTNEKVQEAQALVKSLREEGLLTPEPFDESIEFVAFDLWHYFGRTAKHGAYMGGADFVQWHGNYELLLKMVELKEMAKELRENAHQK
jgi:hydroxylamine dehydrogenase